jgi:uncharacterized repeat protein (TIGR03803 family)
MRPSRFEVVMFVSLALALITTPSTSAQTFTTLHAFIGPEGKNSYATLVQGRDGALYGTTREGGPNGMGVVFRIDTAGNYSILHAFTGPDGQLPDGGLTLGADGNFYGATQNGGSLGGGVVYKMTPTGHVTVLYNFGGNQAAHPYQPPIIGTDGNFYGTEYGNPGGSGQLYKLDRSGNLTTLINSGNMYGPVQTADGLLYVATDGFDPNWGQVTRISTTGTDYEVFNFDATDGAEPVGVSLGFDGNVYGACIEGGNNSISYGDLFSFNSSFNFTQLFTFTAEFGPRTPLGAPLPANDGQLYGTTQYGGTAEDGAIYSYASDGTVTTLYSFLNGTYGSVNAIGQPFQHTSGVFYGTTEFGGPRALNGQVYSFDNGLRPFVTFVVPHGRVGQAIQILGQSLTGTVRVTFNGIAASNFTVVSDTYMTAVVPSGATTGKVVVTTPGGTLASNVSFRIIQ